LFSTYFIASKRERKTSIDMARIRQAKGKDLKEYVPRFNREAVLIPNLQDGVAYSAFFMDYSQGDSSFPLLKARLPLWQMR